MSRDISNLEPNLEAWVARELKVLGDLGVSTRQLASAFAAEIVGVSRVDQRGIRHAPDQFNISLNVDDASRLADAWDDLQAAVIEGLRANLDAAGFQIGRRLHISFSTGPTLGRGGIQVIAWHSGDPLMMEEQAKQGVGSGTAEGRPDAFLVVDGSWIFRLVTDRVAIGRKLDNDLVLDNPRVSRRHALIQNSAGQFVIEDLQSTAGTMVNGRPIRSVALQPGDVIRMAESELVYGESPGEPPSRVAPYEGPAAGVRAKPSDTTLAIDQLNAPGTESPPGEPEAPSEVKQQP